jgi:hypothetical protein
MLGKPGPIAGIIIVFVVVAGCGLGFSRSAQGASYPVHPNIATTYFWVGEPGSQDNDYIPNDVSAWDENWLQDYGGVDDPNNRNGYYPAGFTPKENPFYFALPYNDFDDKGNRKADASQVYWWGSRSWARDESCCKNRWIEITKGSQKVYAQWEDVGPFGEDDVGYVFGTSNPSQNAGLDVSPAVRDCLKLQDEDITSWQFVDTASVPQGPWTEIVTGDEVPPVTPPPVNPVDYKYFSYFAEGCTRPGFDEWLCLMNPNSRPAGVRLAFMFADGTSDTKDLTIDSTTRTTIKVNDVVGADKDVSIKVSSDQPIVAERPMYFNYGPGWNGGHDVMGAAQTQTSFFFAEGCTRPGFDEWLCLMNPNSSAATAYVTYMFQDGTTKLQDVPIAATSRKTVKVNDIVAPDKDVSIKVTSSAAIVAERPMYFNYGPGWNGGHDVMGL